MIENARIRPIAGEARRTSSWGLVPAQNSIANMIVTKTIALPRSGWSMTRAKGIPTMTPG